MINNTSLLYVKNGQPHIFVLNTGEKESLTFLCQVYKVFYKLKCHQIYMLFQFQAYSQNRYYLNYK